MNGNEINKIMKVLERIEDKVDGLRDSIELDVKIDAKLANCARELNLIWNYLGGLKKKQ